MSARLFEGPRLHLQQSQSEIHIFDEKSLFLDMSLIVLSCCHCFGEAVEPRLKITDQLLLGLVGITTAGCLREMLASRAALH